MDKSMQMGMAEISVLPESEYIGRTLSEIRLRNEFGLNAIGLRRNGKPLNGEISNAKLKVGDLVLVVGPQNLIKRLFSEDIGFAVIGMPAELSDMAIIYGKVAQRINRITDDEAVQAMDFLTEHRQTLGGIGLFDGLAGALIATLLYVEAGHEAQESLAAELWERLSSQLSQPHNLSFRTGLTGVGWALIYAASHGLIEDSIDAELALIDRQVATLSLRRCDDLSFLDGLGGIYGYVTARLGYDRRRGLPETTFAPGFLEEMDAEARRVLTDSDDWRTKNFAGQFTERHADDWEILAPEFPEIVELPDYLPNDVGKWQLTLPGIVGSVINKLINEFH